jgi:hypothetical protein
MIRKKGASTPPFREFWGVFLKDPPKDPLIDFALIDFVENICPKTHRKSVYRDRK